MGSGSSYFGVPCLPTYCADCLTQCVLPITNSAPAWAMAGPVALSAGALSFRLALLSSDALGPPFCFFLDYLNMSQCTDQDRTVGINFNFGQNNILQATNAGITQYTGENTQESFAAAQGGGYSSAANNTSAVMSRTGLGTPADQVTITARNGTVSQYFGFHPSIVTPARLKSVTDRFGNTQSHVWSTLGGLPRLQSVSDAYGRTSNFSYFGSSGGYRLQQVTDFWGRQVNLQFDSGGRLVAVVGPSITRGANGNANTFPNGTAYVFQYDVNNPRPERRNDLIRIWHPNQVAPYVGTGRTVDVASAYASATPRRQISYYNDPTDSFHYGKVQQVTETVSGSGSVGSGAWGYTYLNSGLPANLINPNDPIVSRTIVTDRNGNQSIYDFNAAQMVVHKQQFATRGKNSLEASSWETWTSYNSHNQQTLTVLPEGIQSVYEDETNTIQFNSVPYGRRIGLLKQRTRFPGNSLSIPSRPGSNGQTQLTELYFYDPIFAQQCAAIEPRGNPINASGTFFTPQNGGTTPTSADKSRYATITYYDYQKDTAATVQADTALQAQLGLSSGQIGQLITFVNNQMNAPTNQGPLPAGFEMGIGDVNGEGTGAGTANNARHQGCVVQIKHPAVRQLVANTGSGDPWVWQTQSRLELFTSNALGQQTTATNPEGNLTVYVRFPQNNPDGDNDVTDPVLSNKQYGRVKEIHVDTDPSTVMTLVGSDGDMITFIGNKIPRTNTPGVYQNLVTKHQGAAGCTSCNYDPLGNILTTVDARGNLAKYDRNELGEIYRVTMPAPYLYQVETSYDANRNVIQVDTQDMVVQYTSSDPASPSYAQFTSTGSGSTANVPMTAGPGGSVRPGWFSNIYEYDLLDNKIQDDIDSTGSTPSSLVTNFAYDFNQNLIKITKPLGNLVEYDYDERDLRIATRVGYDPAHGQNGAVTISAFDGNGNLVDTVGAAQRGTAAQTCQ